MQTLESRDRARRRCDLEDGLKTSRKGDNMKKIPTVFERRYENHKVVGISDTFTNEQAKIAFLEGEATIKWDGSCCAIINGELYKRYDAKKGKKPPQGAIPCCEADPITGHHPHWVKCDPFNPADKWFWKAFETMQSAYVESVPKPPYFDGCRARIWDGTYEAVGEHFQGNPYNVIGDLLIRHGDVIVNDVPREFDGVREWLESHYIEGLVFWMDEEPIAKIKRSDFGLPWNEKK